MILDALLMLSDAQAITVDAVSTNVIDFGNVTPKREVGTGVPLCVVITVDVAASFADADETYTFELIESTAENMGSPVILYAQQFLTPLLVAGSILILPIPPGYPKKRYFALNYNTANTTPTGTFTAFVAPLFSVAPASVTYANAYTISG